MDAPSNCWIWIGTICGVIGAAGALGWLLTSLPGWIWGGADVKVWIWANPYYGLFCKIQNMPVEGLAYVFKVNRHEVPHLSVKASIFDKSTSPKLRQRWNLEFLHGDGTFSQHVTLRSSSVGIQSNFLKVERGSKVFDPALAAPCQAGDGYLYSVVLNNRDQLAEGNYTIKLHVSGTHKPIDKEISLIVTNAYPFITIIPDDLEEVLEIKKTLKELRCGK